MINPYERMEEALTRLSRAYEGLRDAVERSALIDIRKSLTDKQRWLAFDPGRDIVSIVHAFENGLKRGLAGEEPDGYMQGVVKETPSWYAYGYGYKCGLQRRAESRRGGS